MSEASVVLDEFIHVLRSMPDLGTMQAIGMNLGTRFGPEIIVLYIMDRTFRSVASKLSPLLGRLRRRNNRVDGHLPEDRKPS